MQRRICTIPTEEGRKTLFDRVLKVRGRDGAQELHVTGEEECKQLLQQRFGLTINDRLNF
ncbi:MAG: hypothetical protein DYH04_10830 [Nitrospira sp. NTP2]|nr:hypothetical protein [Nitrospira sp. NTP2]